MTGVSELSKLDKYLSTPAEQVGKQIEASGELAPVCQYFELIA